MSADVLYGESKLSARAVSATLQRATADAQALVRIQTSLAINEPVVTVVVRAGCTAPFTRRYVLLADPVSEPARSSVTASAGGVSTEPRAPAAAQLPAVSAPVSNALPEPTVRGSNGGAAAPRAAKARRAAAQRPARAQAKPRPDSTNNAARSAMRQPAAAQPAPAAKPRLELDPIDLGLAIERDPVLKLSLSLLSEPANSEEARAAAGRLWQAINASPKDILLNARRLEALSAEVSALRAAQTVSQATIIELTSRLEQSRRWPWWVVALGALLALSLLGLVWMWRQQKTRQRFADDNAWWTKEEGETPSVRSPLQPRGAAVSPSLLDLDLTLAPDGGPSALRSLSRSAELNDGKPPHGDDSALTPLADDRAEFAYSQTASRSVATEELFDVQQQADFFISLGEDEQAISVLRDHIAESQVPSALAYLDLLKIYHRQGRQDEYEQLRADFNGLFNAGAPVFDQFNDEGRGLEFYERALARIQALWPQPRVLDVIEQSIFRQADNLPVEVFDLEAYRELLLLYAMAKEMIERETVDSTLPKDFENTKVQALKATARRGAATSSDHALVGSMLPTHQQPPASPNLGLDINLDDLSKISAFEASLPDVDLAVEPTAQAVRHDKIPGQHSNLIFFELLDFTQPDEGAPAAEPVTRKAERSRPGFPNAWVE